MNACPSNTVCRGTCDMHSPVRPEHRCPPTCRKHGDDLPCGSCIWDDGQQRDDEG